MMSLYEQPYTPNISSLFGEQNSPKNENDLKDIIYKYLSYDFLIIEEAEGVINSDGITHKVRIDFLLKAKSHLIDKGFTDAYFGIECKYISKDKRNVQVSNLFAQCLVYRQSIFQNRGIEPFAVLAFTNLSFDKIINSITDNVNAYNKDLLLLLSRFNVGYLAIGYSVHFFSQDRFNAYSMVLGVHKLMHRKGIHISIRQNALTLLGSFTGSNRRYNRHQTKRAAHGRPQQSE